MRCGQASKMLEAHFMLLDLRSIFITYIYNTLQSLYILILPRNDRIGVISITCPEFFMIDFTGMSYALCTVPLYETLGPEAVPYIINHANCRLVFTSVANFAKIQKVAKICPNLKAVIVFGDKIEEISAHFPEPDFTPFDRTADDDHDFFKDTFDPLDADTLLNGKDESPNREVEFKKYTTFNGKTLKELEDEEQSK